MDIVIGSIIGGVSGLIIVYLWQLVSYKIWKRNFDKQCARERADSNSKFDEAVRNLRQQSKDMIQRRFGDD